MKPIIILPPGEMSDEHIKELRDNGLCVVVAKNPATVKFVDPIPAASSRTEIESAAIALSRIVLAGQLGNYASKGTVCETFVQLLVRGTGLDPDGTREEQEQEIITAARRDELAKIAREETRAEQAKARADRAAKRAEIEAAKKK